MGIYRVERVTKRETLFLEEESKKKPTKQIKYWVLFSVYSGFDYIIVCLSNICTRLCTNQRNLHLPIYCKWMFITLLNWNKKNVDEEEKKKRIVSFVPECCRALWFCVEPFNGLLPQYGNNLRNKMNRVICRSVCILCKWMSRLCQFFSFCWKASQFEFLHIFVLAGFVPAKLRK